LHLIFYINQYYKLKYDINWDNFNYLTPGPLFYYGFKNYPKGLQKAIFSHDTIIGRFFRGRKVIFLTRNIFDIIVSYYFFHRNRDKDFYNNIEINDFALNYFDLKRTVNKLNYFANQLRKASDYKIIEYEKLLNDPNIFYDIIKFSPFPYNEEIIKNAIDYASFNNMRELEKQKISENTQEKFHTRSGQSYKYKKYLNNNIIEQITNYLENNLHGIFKKYYF